MPVCVVVLVGSPTVAGRTFGNRVFPSFRPAICPGIFLDWIIRSLNFGMALQTFMKLCVTEPEFLENLFCPKFGEMYQK